jgi:hypothetical protein
MANNLQTRTVGRFRMDRKESLRSRPRVGFGGGQGSTWNDPRFPVRASDLCCGRLRDYSHNTGFSAGGPTFGGMISTRMTKTSRMRHGYVRGNGNGNLIAPRAAGRSQPSGSRVAQARVAQARPQPFWRSNFITRHLAWLRR